jgi:CheY-like chemotaxis protein
MNAPQHRIAIVEDNPDNRMLLEALLSDLYEIDEYEDGIVGLEGLRASPPQLVLLDISLPSMTGIEVLDHMRADPLLAAIPVIALTAHAMPDDRANFLAQGFDAYISKPIVDEALLFDEIERLLSGRRES